MVNPIESTFEINDPWKIKNYYSIFINTMAATFGVVLNCGITKIAANDVINTN
jgi:hypothetical protein